MIKTTLLTTCIIISMLSCNRKSTTTTSSQKRQDKLTENRKQPINVSDQIDIMKDDLNTDACLVKVKVIAIGDSSTEVEIREVVVCRTVSNEPKVGDILKIGTKNEELMELKEYVLELSFPNDRKGNSTTLLKKYN